MTASSPASQRWLIVTIDTERDYDPQWRIPGRLSFRSVTEAIPKRLTPLFEGFGVRPVYLLSPEVVCDAASADVLRDTPNCELGTHLHGEYVLPHIRTWDFADPTVAIQDMQWQYPLATEREKLEVLTELFVQQFGYRPKSFRAGRFGAGHSTGGVLLDLGYAVDSSVAPHTFCIAPDGARFPDYRSCPERPYRVCASGDLWRSGDSSLLEVPLTILAPDVVSVGKLGKPVWFRPSYADADSLCAVMRHVVAERPQHARPRPLVMMFHSEELIPGASPYTQTEGDVARYLEALKSVFALAEQLGMRSCTLIEYYDHHCRAAPEPDAALKLGGNAAVSAASRHASRAPALCLPASIVEPALQRHDVQPWFRYAFRERATRWDCWRPCFWMAENCSRDAFILSLGTGVGFNLFWLAENGFQHLYGLDVDAKAIAAGRDIARESGLPVSLWVDDALAPKQLAPLTYDVIEALNWTHLLEDFSLEHLLESYLPAMAEDGVFIFDVIDPAYNLVPGNQFHTQDRNRPVRKRRPSEYKTRLTEAQVRGALAAQGLAVVKVICEPQPIPKSVYVARRHYLSLDPTGVVGAERLARQTRPRILLIADVPDWIFARHCQVLFGLLSDDFAFTLQYRGQPIAEDQFDLLYPLEWYLVPPAQIRMPEKWVTGIRSHTMWQERGFFNVLGTLATKFQRVHAVSERLVRLFKPFLPSIDYVTHGVDTTFFTPTTRTDQSGQRLRLGWAGSRANPTKGFDELIRPLARLPGVELVFCGHLDQNLSIDRMRDFYDSLDAYVCASHFEGNNNSLLEAAAMQRAIVTTDNGTTPEYLRHRDNAFIVERDLPSIVHAVLELRDNPAMRATLGERARRAVVEKFEWRMKARDFSAFFLAALAGRYLWRPPPDPLRQFLVAETPASTLPIRGSPVPVRSRSGGCRLASLVRSLWGG
jgi:glycosyltransferase involved in cell wall biosynthesis